MPLGQRAHARGQRTLHELRLQGVRGISAHLLIVGLLVVAPLAADAQRDTLRLTLSEARQRAAAANPDLAAAELDTAIAAGGLRQARVLPFNPSADALPARKGLGAEYGLSQEVEVFGQRGLRVRAGTARLDRARSEVVDARRVTLGEVDRVFYRLVSASRRSDLASEVRTLNERLADIASRQLIAGEISRLDYNLALIELGRSRSNAIAVGREQHGVEIELGRLLGLPTTTQVVAVLDPGQHQPPAPGLADTTNDVRAIVEAAALLNVDSLTSLAIKLRPDLAARSATVRQARSELALAQREALPNLLVRGVMETDDAGKRVIRPGVGMTLPLFNRNQGEVQSRRAAANQTGLQLAAAIARVRAEITTAVQAYRSAAAQVEIFETTVLVPARQNRQLLETAYREGKVGLPVLLLIRNQVFDAELDYWTAWLAEREALAFLEEATGRNVAQFPSIR